MAESSLVISAADVGRFLFGSREAILKIARSPMAMLVGGLFVLSGALAREYDGVSFAHKPVVLVRPLMASLVLSSVLYAMCVYSGRRSWERERGDAGGEEPSYLAFLRCYWMTAPMAWLYAYPAERLWDPATAVAANMWLLLFVSVWRVTLISRVISVLWGARHVPVLLVVLLFGDAAVLTGTALLGKELPIRMGGVRGSARDEAVAGMIFGVMFLTAMLFLPLLIAGVMGSVRWRPKLDSGLKKAAPARIGWSLWLLVAASLASLGSLMAWAQPQHFRAREVDDLILSGRVEEAMDTMVRQDASAYPSFWEPSPAIEGMGSNPEMDRVVAYLDSHDAPEWVLRRWATKVAKEAEMRGWRTEASEPRLMKLEAFMNTHEALVEPSQLLRTREWLQRRREHSGGK